MIKLALTAVDESTYVITAALSDAAGNAIIPASITWTLTNREGTVINGRQDVPIASPAASNDITLSGDDLSFADGEWRVFTFKATYSSTEGSNLPLNEEGIFRVRDLLNV